MVGADACRGRGDRSHCSRACCRWNPARSQFGGRHRRRDVTKGRARSTPNRCWGGSRTDAGGKSNRCWGAVDLSGGGGVGHRLFSLFSPAGGGGGEVSSSRANSQLRARRRQVASVKWGREMEEKKNGKKRNGKKKWKKQKQKSAPPPPPQMYATISSQHPGRKARQARCHPAPTAINSPIPAGSAASPTGIAPPSSVLPFVRSLVRSSVRRPSVRPLVRSAALPGCLLTYVQYMHGFGR